MITEATQRARDEYQAERERVIAEREGQGKWFEAWRKHVIDTVSVTIQDDVDLWRKVADDRARWNAYAELTINAWEKGLYVWYCAFCERIEYAPSTEMFGFAADYAEGTGGHERSLPNELHIQPDHSLPVPPEGWAMSSQGPICMMCQKVHEHEPPLSLKREEQRRLTCYVKNTIVEQLPCE